MKKKTRGPQKAPTKVSITVRLDPVVVEHFRSSGDGWQTRLNDTLVQVVSREQRRSRQEATR